MKTINFLIFISLFTIIFSSCNKYEEGPKISFLSAKNRVAGDYTLAKYLVNGQEIILSDIGIAEYRKVYNADGTGTSYVNLQERSFEWEFDEKKENIRERSQSTLGEWSDWSSYNQILKLTDNELWIIDNNSPETSEYHFIEQ